MFGKLKENYKKAQEQFKSELNAQAEEKNLNLNLLNECIPERLKEKKIIEVKAEYGGGHPDYTKLKKGTLTVNKLGIYFGSALNIYFKIPIELILNVEYKTEDQLRTDAAIARYELFGIFSAGMSAKRSFLVINYNESGLTNKIIFESQDAPKLVSAIMKARQEYVKSEEPTGNMINTSSDIPEQIKKLAELKEQGILSQEEFDTKKKELLSRM